MTTEELLDQITHTLADPEVGPDAARTQAPELPGGVMIEPLGRITRVALADNIAAMAGRISELIGSRVLGVVHLPGGKADLWFSVTPVGDPNLAALALLDRIGSEAPVPFGPAIFTGCLDADQLGLPESEIAALCAHSLD